MTTRRRYGFARRALALTVFVLAGYALVLTFPQPLFAYTLRHEQVVLHATRPIPPAMTETLSRVNARVTRSGIVDPADVFHVFLCDEPWLFALFARQNYRVGGVANVFIGQHVFLRESDMENDRLIGPSGSPVAADRPLSYFIAHEVMHIAHGRRLGLRGYARLPQWVDDGHADYVARDIDLGATLDAFKAGARELDPARSGLYLRYHLLVAYLLEKKGIDRAALLQSPPPQEVLEREVAGLTSWGQ